VTVQLWWGTETAATLNGSRSLTAEYTADGTAQVVRFDVYTHAKWDDRVDVMWIQPFVNPVDGATFAIEDIGAAPRADVVSPSDQTGFSGDGVSTLRIGGGALRGTLGDNSATLSTPLSGPVDLYSALVLEAAIEPGAACTLGVTVRTAEGGAFSPTVNPVCDGTQQRYILDPPAGGWTGQLSVVDLVLPAGNGVRSFSVSSLRFAASGASYELESVTVPKVLVVGEDVNVTARVANHGPVKALGGKLVLNGQLVFLPEIPPYQTVDVEWTLPTASSCSQASLQTITVTAQFVGPNGTWTQARPTPLRWLDALTALPPQVPPEGSGPSGAVTPDAIFLQNDQVRATLHNDPCLGGFGYIRYFVADGDSWEPVGGRLGLGTLRHRLLNGVIEEVTITNAVAGAIDSVDGQLTVPLSASWIDGDGVTWSFTWSFVVRSGKPVIEMTSAVSPSGKRDVLFFEGPLVELGLGTTAPELGTAWQSGVARLESGQTTDDSDAIVTADYRRSTPHVGLVQQPVMGVQADDVLVAMLWAPSQLWSASTGGPLPSLLLPDSSGSNAILRLAAPNTPSFIVPGEQSADGPVTLFPGNSLSLTASYAAVPGGGASELVALVRGEQGIPSAAQIVDGAVRERVRLGLSGVGWTGSAWKLGGDQGTTIAGDVLAAAHAIAAVDDDAALLAVTATAAGFNSATAWMAGPTDWVGMDAPWRFGHIIEAVKATRALLELQDDSTPSATSLIAAEHAEQAGSMFLAWRLLRLGRISGLQSLVDRGLTRLGAVSGLNIVHGGLVAEGVPSLAPDVSSAIDATMAHLEAYEITGETEYLERAAHFANEAMLFVSTHGFASLGGSGTYAVVAAYGARHFTESLFGVSDSTQALRLGLACAALHEADPTKSWGSISDGLFGHVLSQIVDSDGAEPIGHFPIGLDLRTGHPVPGFRLPHLAARVLAARAGESTILKTVTLEGPAGETVEATSLLSVAPLDFDVETYAVQFTVPEYPPTGDVFVSVGN
ncbi:MAG: hypothetical protein ACI9OJ_006075, partial [Myxococcota bacterium]